MNTFFNLIQPIANLPIFLLLNLGICLIAVHWYWMKSTDNFNDKLHRNMQRLGLFISILIIGILFVKQWNIGDFPFYYAQIAPFNYGKNNSAFLREAQLKSSQSLKNAEMVVTLDIGDYTQIHPSKKKEVGKRLATKLLFRT